MNHKRVERIWRKEGLKVPRKQPKRRRLWLNDGSCVRLRPEHKDHVWSYDFVMARTADSRAFRMLNIIDEYTRECLAENCQYRRVHIVSFGMGIITALDSLFPRGQPILRFQGVDTLLTIACPADIILHYYPQYFTDRRRLEGVPRRWMNIFVPSDLMASNFIEGDSYNEVPEEQKKRKLAVILPKAGRQSWSGIRIHGKSEVIHPDSNVRHALTSPKGGASRVFAAVRAHQSYWDRTSITSASVFDTIVQELFPAGNWNVDETKAPKSRTI